MQQPLLTSHTITEGTFKMAITPEIKPRISVSAGSEYDVAPMRSTTAESRQERMEGRSNNGIFYALTVLALIVAGYFAYTYYYAPTPIAPTTTNQTTTPVTPPVAPPVVVPAPSATTPAAPPVTPPVTP
jgi:hypothetical protein